MGYENRFDGSLSITAVAQKTKDVLPAELLAKADALGFSLVPKHEGVGVWSLIEEAKKEEFGRFFFRYFEYDEETSSLIPNSDAEPGNFPKFGAAVEDVVDFYYDKGYCLTGTVYRLGEERDDVERVKVGEDGIEAEHAEAVFRFRDGAVYVPPPL